MNSNERKRKELEGRKQTIVASLPPFAEMMRGSIFERRIKCGKASCRCGQGKGHPTTYLGVSFKGGKTVQITVPKKLASRVRKLVENYSEFWAALEQISEINRQLLRKRLLESDPNEDRSR
jgi:hypothetical protein